MTMNNKVTKHLAKAAQANGICTPWLNELKSLDDKDALVDMYIRGIDFCLEHDYPSNDFIRENFKGVMEKHGVFLDDAIALQTNPSALRLERQMAKSRQPDIRFRKYGQSMIPR